MGFIARAAVASALVALGGISSGFAAQPSNPLKIVKVRPSGGNVVVSWDGGRGPYQLLCRTNLTGEWRKVGSPTSLLDATNPAMPGPTCIYRVTTDLSAPSTPRNLAVSTNTVDTELVLRWDSVTDNSGGVGMKGYNIYRNNVFIKRVLPTATTTVDTGLNPDTTYSYTVSAEDLVANESARTSSVSAKTPRRNDTTAPTVPTGLAVTAASCSAINLSWAASSDTGGSLLKGYNVYRSGVFLAQVLAPTTSYSDPNRAAQTTYGYTVSAVDNANNQSAQSAYQSATTPACPDFSAPAVPTGLTASAADCSTINLSWYASTDTGGSGLRGYYVYRGGTYAGFVQAPSTYYGDTGRAASTSYSYTVLAIDNANNTSAQSLVASATTPACVDLVAPAVPTGLTASAANCNTINLSWYASTDTGGSGLKGYYVYRNGAYVNFVQAPSTSYGDTGRAASSSYSYTVVAIDNANNTSAQSFAASATTPSCPDSTAPAVPSGLVATSAGTNRINLSWNASVDNAGGSGLAGYYIWRNSVYLGTSATTSYSDVGLAPSTTYCYTVAAYDYAGNNSVQSAQACAATAQMSQSCTYSLSPASANPGSGALSGTFNVTTGPTCSWTPSSSASWLTFSPASGVGNGTVTWYVTANTSTASRSGTLNIGGQTFSVTQAGSTGTGGAAQWVKSMLSTPNGYKANGWSVAADASANVIVAGDFNGTVDFGGGVTAVSLSSDDGFLAKYTPQGALLWSKTYSGTANQSAKSVAVDRQGNVIVAGSFSATVDFGAGPLTAADPSGLWAPDMFIAKYTPSGVLMWAKQFGGTAGDFGNAVAVDGSDNIILVGRLGSQNVNFGGGFTLSSAGGFDVAIVKLSPTGATLWAKRYGGRYDEMPNAAAVDLNGDIAITGQINNGSADLGGGTFTVSTLFNTIFVAKYSGVDGTYRWAKAFGGSSVDGGNGITTDPRNGNIVVTGGFMSTAHFDGGNTANSSSRTASGETVFLAGYGPSGNFLWVNAIGGGSGTTDWGNGVKIDSNGNLALTGSKGNPWEVGGTWLFNAGFFMMRYTISGDTAPTFQRIQVAETGSTGGSVGCSVAIDPAGQILTTGNFCFGTVNFGGASATTLSSSYSGYLTKYSN